MSPWARKRKRRRLEFEDLAAAPRYWLYVVAGSTWLILMMVFLLMRAFWPSSASPLVGGD